MTKAPNVAEPGTGSLRSLQAYKVVGSRGRLNSLYSGAEEAYEQIRTRTPVLLSMQKLRLPIFSVTQYRASLSQVLVISSSSGFPVQMICAVFQFELQTVTGITVGAAGTAHRDAA